jgi:hypothetical protein
MRNLLLFSLLMALVATLLLRTGVAGRPTPGEARTSTPTGTPQGGIEVLEVVPFALDEPFVHEWRAERPSVSAGLLLALRADAELARTRQTFEPVLFVGSQTAERCNAPLVDGQPAPPDGKTILIALVPAPLTANDRVALDLEREPIWFGGLELPENVDSARIADERRRAAAAGVRPARPADRATYGSAPVHVRDRIELEATYLADLLERWVPEEVDRIATLRGR